MCRANSKIVSQSMQSVTDLVGYHFTHTFPLFGLKFGESEIRNKNAPRITLFGDRQRHRRCRSPRHHGVQPPRRPHGSRTTRRVARCAAPRGVCEQWRGELRARRHRAQHQRLPRQAGGKLPTPFSGLRLVGTAAVRHPQSHSIVCRVHVSDSLPAVGCVICHAARVRRSLFGVPGSRVIGRGVGGGCDCVCDRVCRRIIVVQTTLKESFNHICGSAQLYLIIHSFTQQAGSFSTTGVRPYRPYGTR